MLGQGHTKEHGVSLHCYADDTKLYMPLKVNDSNAQKALLDCLNDLKRWMSLIFFFFM